MRNHHLLPFSAVIVVLLLTVRIPLGAETTETPEGKWSGVDETVVEKFAEEAGRSPRAPYINVGEGDMLLFCFLMAGTIGGFILGYYFRVLFPKDHGSAK